jgi:exopolysaccharide biosynthesis polyprenyl glycosylphosphotransferase
MDAPIWMRERSSLLKRLLYFFDAGVSTSVLILAIYLYGITWSRFYTILVVCVFFLSVFVFDSYEVYRSIRNDDLFKEAVLITRAWAVIVAVVVFSLFSFGVSKEYSRVSLYSWFLSAPLLLIFGHFLVRGAFRSFASKYRGFKNAVIVGHGVHGEQIAKTIKNSPWLGVNLLGFFDDRDVKSNGTWEDSPILGRIADLPSYLAENSVDFVYIALSLGDLDKTLHILQTCRTLGCEIYLVPNLLTFKIFNTEMQRLGDNIVLSFNPRVRGKRYFDILFSLAAIVVTLPCTLVIALLVKLHDGGPVFYGHPRITSGGRRFKCLKFRTMCVDADRRLADLLERDPQAREEWEKTFKLKNDPRVTKIGSFLRKTSLDELPQFINVLKGDMSVVVARPIVYKELCNYYKETSGLYCSVRPGITGPWQTSSRSDTEDYDERVRMDEEYILNCSFWGDLKIILKTTKCIFSGKGAY